MPDFCAAPAGTSEFLDVYKVREPFAKECFIPIYRDGSSCVFVARLHPQYNNDNDNDDHTVRVNFLTNEIEIYLGVSLNFDFSLKIGPPEGASFRSLPYNGPAVLKDPTFNNCVAADFENLVVTIDDGEGHISLVQCPAGTSCQPTDLAPPTIEGPISGAIQNSETFFNAGVSDCDPCEASHYVTGVRYATVKQFHDNGQPCVSQEGVNRCVRNHVAYDYPELAVSVTAPQPYGDLSGSYSLKFTEYCGQHSSLDYRPGGAQVIPGAYTFGPDSYFMFHQGWHGTFYGTASPLYPYIALAIDIFVSPVGAVISPNYVTGSVAKTFCSGDSRAYICCAAVYCQGQPFNPFGDYKALGYWNHCFTAWDAVPCGQRVCRSLPSFGKTHTLYHRLMGNFSPLSEGWISFQFGTP